MNRDEVITRIELRTEISELILQLQDADYGKQLIALGKLVEAGERAVPFLYEALARKGLPTRISVACALSGIGVREPEVIKALIGLWEKHLENPVLNQALLMLAKKLVAEQRTENTLALICFLNCWRRSKVASNGEVTTEGKQLSIIASNGLGQLAYQKPTRQLRDALPHLKKNIWIGSPSEFDAARKIIEENTAHWKDLPLIASAPDRDATGLPLPAEEQAP